MGRTTQEITQEKIIRLIKQKPEITRKETAALLGLSPDGVKYHLNMLKQAGRIRHVGPTKKGRWEILRGKITQEIPLKTAQETTQEKIMGLIRQKPEITRKEIAALLDLSPDGVKYHLNMLKQAGRIRHVGPTKKGRWEILDKNNEMNKR